MGGSLRPTPSLILRGAYPLCCPTYARSAGLTPRATLFLFWVLGRPPGICSLPPFDWPLTREYARSPPSIGPRHGLRIASLPCCVGHCCGSAAPNWSERSRPEMGPNIEPRFFRSLLKEARVPPSSCLRCTHQQA
eukprot:1185975-Prorocentrum_minimum.AAC.1